MKSIFLCTYIIAYTHSDRNFKILKNNLEVLTKDPRTQIIVIEASKNPNLKYLDLKAEYVHLKTDTYNLGWIFNIGFKHAKSDKIFFGDNKYHPNISIMGNVIQGYGNRDMIYCQSSLIKLNKEETDNRNAANKSPVDANKSGIIFFTREGYLKCGGFDENVFGQDFWDILIKKTENIILTGVVNNVSTIELTTDDIPINGELLEYSSKHLKRVMVLDTQGVTNYIKAQFKKIGNYHKYDKIDVLFDV
jgi:hypothetical protein